jgi:hypothetical protein
MPGDAGVMHTLDAIGDKGNLAGGCVRELLLHNKWIHIGLLVLLGIDGGICLACGVLEVNYLEGKSKDCKTYVSTCMKHRRLSDRQSSDPFWLNGEALDVGDEYDYEEDGRHSSRPHFSAIAGALRSAMTPRRLSATTTLHSHGSRSMASVKNPLCVGHPHFGNHALHDAEKVLAYISIGILSIFLIEQIALIAELQSEYCKPMFILDFFVILSSLIIEILVTNFAVGGLLVIARAWRFARVGHGVFETTEKVHEMVKEDSTYESLVEIFDKLDDSRWKEIKHTLNAEDEKEQMNAEEKALGEALSNNPAVALRALAFARAYMHHRDKKLRLQQMGLRPSGNTTGTGQKIGAQA